MNSYESKLLSQWPLHQSRGMAIFILYRGVFFAIPGLAVLLLCQFLIFHNPTLGFMVYLSALVLALGVIRSAYQWHKMEHLYGDLQKQKN